MELIGKAKLSRLFTYLFTSLYCEWVPRTLYKRRITVQYSASVFLIVYKLLLRVYIQYCLLVLFVYKPLLLVYSCFSSRGSRLTVTSVYLFVYKPAVQLLKPRQQTYSGLNLFVYKPLLRVYSTVYLFVYKPGVQLFLKPRQQTCN